jgi:intracellular sulfur oxidation DsrE/DsrF family protein
LSYTNATVDLNDDVKHVSKGIDKILHKQHSEEDRDIIQWITAIDYAPQQHDFLKRRQPGTGQWLLECTEFQEWLKDTKRGLFCPGIPGSGKTIVIDHLSTKFQEQSDVGIAFIFCNFRRHHEQTLEDLLAALLKQLTQQQSVVPSGVTELYNSCKKKRADGPLSKSCPQLYSVCLLSLAAPFLLLMLLTNVKRPADVVMHFSTRCSAYKHAVGQTYL